MKIKTTSSLCFPATTAGCGGRVQTAATKRHKSCKKQMLSFSPLYLNDDHGNKRRLKKAEAQIGRLRCSPLGGLQ